MKTTRLLIASAAIVALLAGCAPSIQIAFPTEPTPDAAIYSALGSPDVAGLADSMTALGDELTGELEGMRQETLAAFGVEDIPQGGGMAIAPVRTVVPGLDTPIAVSRENQQRTRTSPHGPVHEVGRVESGIVDQQLRYSMEYSARLDESADVEAADDRRSDIDVEICRPDDEGRVSGEWSHVRRVVDTDARGTTTRMEISAVASVTSGPSASGAMNVTSFILKATRTTTTAGGATTTERGDVSARFGQWGADGMPTQRDFESISDASSSQTSDWFEAEVGKLVLGTLGASTAEIKAMLAAAMEARNETGLCVSIEYDTGGVTTLGPGEQATITARVVETRTGEPIEDAPINASTLHGTVTPGSGTGETQFTFTAASSPPPYIVDLSTSSPLGGDHVEVVFAGGWKFEGVTLTISVNGRSASQTWSGIVCGDPFTDPWVFTQVVEGAETLTYDLVVPPLGTRITGEYGQQPMIEEIHNPGKGDPPFRLYIDDVEPPEVSPQTQRVEVPVKPAGEECAGG